jgi:hypothetical protein
MYQILTVPCVGEISPLKFNLTLACSAGILFSSGWWLMIGLLAENAVTVVGFLPGVFSSVALIIVNMIPISLIQEPTLYAPSSRCGRLTVKTCLLIGFMIAFGSLIGACYILFNDYVLDAEERNKWPGCGIFLQNLLIFAAAVLLKLRRSQEYF